MDPYMTSVAVDRIQDLAAAVLRLRTVAAHGHCQSHSGARQTPAARVRWVPIVKRWRRKLGDAARQGHRIPLQARR